MVYKDMILAAVVTLIVAMATTLAAPVAQNKAFEPIKAQEEALETLAANSQSGMLPKSIDLAKTFSYSSINGAVNKENKFEETEVDPSTGNVIADIKEKLKEVKTSPDSPMQKSFKASLDVPAAGIHKEVSNSGSNEVEDPKDTVEFTPQAVAEYLARTGEMDEFKELLNELVEASEITSDDAESYEKNVMDAYFALPQETLGNQASAENEASYFPESKQPTLSNFNDMEQEDVFPLYGFGQNPVKAAEDARMDMYINYLMNRPVSLDEMISSLMDEWLTRAIITGDPEAEEILSNIIDYVTQDDNPNDEEQVRAILGDIFAEALLEDLTPRIEPNNLPDVQPAEQSLLPAQLESEHVNSVEAAIKKEDDNSIPETIPEQTDDLVKTEQITDEKDDRPKN